MKGHVANLRESRRRNLSRKRDEVGRGRLLVLVVASVLVGLVFVVAMVSAAPTPSYFSSLGGAGSGAGNLSSPSDVAADSSGNVWVADAGHDRVQEFDSSGEFVRQFGATGSGNGQFSNPSGIAVTAAGNVYVADTGNNRVQEFDSKGEFVRKWGSLGGEPGQFRSLQSIAVDPEGHIWTVGSSTKSAIPVQEFSATGEYLGQLGAKGSEAGQLTTPQAIAVDASGRIWVADAGNDRVSEFKASGEFIRAFGWGVSTGAEELQVCSASCQAGAAGTGEGQLSDPQGLAADAEGNVWVSDAGTDRVQEFSSEGAYLSQFGTAGNGDGQFSAPQGVALDEEGNVWVADTANDRVQEWLTGDAPPVVVTEHAVELAPYEATLTGSVNPEGLKSAYQFEYTSSTDFAENGYANAITIPISPKNIGFADETIEVSDAVAGLEPDTTYHFRVIAENLLGHSEGEDETFTTPEAPLKTPIAAYSFDGEFEFEGKEVYDDIGNHDGTIEGAEWSQGRGSTGLRFDGEDDVLTIPDSPALDLTEGFTLEAWVDPGGSQHWSPVIAKNDSDEEFPSGYVVYAQGGGEGPAGSVSDDESSEESVSGGPALPEEEWTQLALTSDGTVLRLYVNGELEGAASSIPAKSSDGALQIGGSTALGQYFAGRIDDVRIYNEWMSGKEIKNSLDITPPQVELSGPLLESAGGPLGVEKATLGISVGDGEGNAAASGLKDVTVEVDGKAAESVDCGCEEPLAFTYDTAVWGPGANRIAVTAIDKAGNHTTRELVVDKPDGPSIALDGPLYERRNSTVGVKAHKLVIRASQTDLSDAAPRPGVASIEVKVDETTIGEPKTTPCPEGNCSMETEWLLEPTEYSEGSHTISVVASDEAGDTTTRTFNVIIDPSDPCADSAEEPVEGCSASAYEIQHATEYSVDSAGEREFMAEEWIQPGTPNARRKTANEFVWTRGSGPCLEDPEAECGEVRGVGPGNGFYPDFFDVYSEDSNDANLEPVADLNEFDASEMGEPVASGKISEALASWQHAPPDHGEAYDIYESSEDIPEGPTLTLKWWIDRATGLPLRRVVIDEQVYGEMDPTVERRYFDFDQTVLTSKSVAADFFVQEPPKYVSTYFVRSVEEEEGEYEIGEEEAE